MITADFFDKRRPLEHSLSRRSKLELIPCFMDKQLLICGQCEGNVAYSFYAGTSNVAFVIRRGMLLSTDNSYEKCQLNLYTSTFLHSWIH